MDYNGFYWFLFFLLNAHPMLSQCSRRPRSQGFTLTQPLDASPPTMAPQAATGRFSSPQSGSDGLGWEMNHQNHQKPTYILTLPYIT